MVDYISREAARDFLKIQLISHHQAHIGTTVFLDRLATLVWMSEPECGAVAFAREILSLNEWTCCFDPDNQDGGADGALEGPKNKVGYNEEEDEEEDDDFIIQLITIVGDTGWIFHPGDDDFFPSIPHGHDTRDNKRKLDPYLGWIYRGSAQHRRLPRKDIVALWNNDKFRYMASVAIDYYLKTHPHYTGWRVPYPRQLPRKA